MLIKNSVTKKKIIILSVILICNIFLIWYYLRPEPGFFLRNFLAADVFKDLKDSHLDLHITSNVPGLKYWIAYLHFLTGIPIEDLPSIPVGLIGRTILYIALILKFTKSKISAVTFGIIMAVIPWSGWSVTNSIFVHSLGSIIFLTMVLLLLIGLKRFQPKIAVVLILTFIGAFLLDYTISMWIVYLFFFCFLFFKNKRLRVYFLLIGIIFLTIFLNKNIIHRFFSNFDIYSIFNNFFNYFKKSPVYDYQFQGGYTINNLLSNIYYYVIFAILLLYVIYKVYSIIIKKIYLRGNKEKMLLALIFTGIAAIITYAVYGHFTQFYIFLCAPLIGFIALDNLLCQINLSKSIKKKLIVVFLLTLLLAASIGFFQGIRSKSIYKLSRTDAQESAYWLFGHIHDTPNILSDLTTVGKFRMPQEKNEQEVIYNYYTPEIYKKLVRGSELDNINYIVIDFNTKKGTPAKDWMNFESLHNYKNNINNNTNLNKIYSDCRISIYNNYI